MPKKQPQRRIDKTPGGSARIITVSGGSSGGGSLTAHAIDGAYHTGTLDQSQAPWAVTDTEFSTHTGNANAHHNRQHSIVSTNDHTIAASAYAIVGATANNVLGLLTQAAGDGILLQKASQIFTWSLDEDFSPHWTGVHHFDSILRSETQEIGADITGWRIQADGRADIATIYTNALTADAVTAAAIALNGDLTIINTGGILPGVDATNWPLIQDAAGSPLLTVDSTNGKIIVADHLKVLGATPILEADGTTGNPALRLSENSVAQWDLLYNKTDNYVALAEVGVAEHFRIYDGGNIGVHQANPSVPFHVGSSARFESAVSVGGGLTVTGTGTFHSTLNALTNLNVGVDLAVTDDVTVGDELIVQGDVTLPFWGVDAATGVLQTTGDYAFNQPSALGEYEGIRFTPADGLIESARVSASRLSAETMVFEQVSVSTGDFVVANSGGKLAEAATFEVKAYLTDDAGNRIVDDNGDYIVLADNMATAEIRLDPPVDGDYSLLRAGDQIIIAGRPSTTLWAYGSGFPFPPTRFYPAARVSNLTTDKPVMLRAVVISASGAEKNTYTVQLADSNPYELITFPAGSAVASYGQNGDPYISMQTRDKRAFMDVGTLPGTGWENDLTPFLRLGYIGGLSNVADPGDVGMVGGDIWEGVGQWFKISPGEVVTQNGTHAVRDAAGVARTMLDSTGLNLRLYEDPANVTDPIDALSIDEIYQSSVVWADELDDPDTLFGALYAYKQPTLFGRYNIEMGLRAANVEGPERISSSIGAPGATVTAGYFRDNGQGSVNLDANYLISLIAQYIRIDAGRLSLVGLPTSASGLAAGDLWIDVGTLKIVS